MLRRHAAAAGIASLLASGCSGAGDDDLPIGAEECGLAAVSTPSGCEPAGLPLSSCAPGEVPTMDGCEPAGVPPERCPPSFNPDNGGCYPILPASPCGPSEVALPGETTCRPLVSCGTGRYGDIPIQADTEHVDGSFTGTSDGSPDQPWKTIQEAIAAAAPGVVIAIAAGTYNESFHVEGKPLRIWGTCPQDVVIAGVDSSIATMDFLPGASGSELHNVAVTGSKAGIGLSGAVDVQLESVWVHGTGEMGILAEAALGPTGVSVIDSLVEDTTIFGIIATGAELEVDSSVVRDVSSDTDGRNGSGIVVQAPGFADIPGTGRISNSVVERAREAGIVAAASLVDIERVFVRDTQTNDLGDRGIGIAYFVGLNGVSAQGSAVESTLEGNHEAGVVLNGSSARLDALTIHHTLPSPARRAGVGVLAGESTTYVRSSLELTRSLVDANHEVGVFLGASDGVIEGVLVRGTLPSEAGLWGWGIVIQSHPDTGQRAAAQVRYSAVEASREVGIFVGGSDGTVEATAVRHVIPALTARGGVGITVQTDPGTGSRAKATVNGCLVERVASVGVFVANADARVERCLMRDIQGDAMGLQGDGVSVIGDLEDARLDLFGSRIENGIRAGLSCFGATASLASNAFVCHSFDLEGEPVPARTHRFENLGNNGCGCTEPTETCKAISAGLAPPDPLTPYEK